MNRTVNNRFNTSPAIMNDGRSFTDYRPASYVDSMIAHSNKINGSNEYRDFLIQNGLNLMKVNDMYIEDKMGHRMCNQMNKPGSEFAKVCEINRSTMSCLDTNPQKTGIYFSTEGKKDMEIQGFDKTESKFFSLS